MLCCWATLAAAADCRRARGQDETTTAKITPSPVVTAGMRLRIGIPRFVTENDESHHGKVHKIECVFFKKWREKKKLSVCSLQWERLSKDVRRKCNSYSKAHLIAWLLALAAASQRFCLIKKHPGVCKRVVGASAHPDSLTYWLFKPLRLSHGTRVMNVSSLPSLPPALPCTLLIPPLFFYSSFERVESQWQLAEGEPVVWEAEGISDTEIHTLQRLYLGIIQPNVGSSLATSCMKLVRSSLGEMRSNPPLNALAGCDILNQRNAKFTKMYFGHFQFFVFFLSNNYFKEGNNK